MKIVSIDCFEIRIPYRRKLTAGSGLPHGAHSVIVKVQTDYGIVGAGEASMPGGPVWSGESAMTVLSIIKEYLAPVLIGRDPCRISEIAATMRRAVRGNPFAKAAIEMACFDILGNALGVGAAQLIGGQHRDKVPMVWSLDSGVVEQEIEEVLDVNERLGVRLFKVKVGAACPAVDLERVARLVRNVSPAFEFRLDANQRWNEMTAAWMLPRLRELGITALEQPLPSWDLAGMARLRHQAQLAIVANDSAMNANEVMNVILSAAADMIALKVAKSGGILGTLQSAQVADAAGLSCYLDCMTETGLGTAAYLQTACALKDMRHGAALPGPLMLSEDIIKSPIEYRDGYVELPTGDGLGVQVDWHVVERLSGSHANCVSSRKLNRRMSDERRADDVIDDHTDTLATTAPV
ncbi:enolase C-terminal domain-like protein [Paraburkholderia sp. EG286B]|uniref:enolase C-terminal domain-like protein n=1 Tax=Paraburkholderia sp. EG286B TaxID=3237011 RepID=UPI0034D2A254